VSNMGRSNDEVMEDWLEYIKRKKQEQEDV
jgi:hypothetical protein